MLGINEVLLEMIRLHYYTIGMAGHIDHGKTTLTKALTGVDTDRLKEEKERGISIELGYGPFPLDEFETSIVDVPGHEKLIRQMIAGVAGIDLVLLVIAADEGIMPQTMEHLEILSFLGVKHGVLVITKVDKVEQEFLELVEEDIRSAVEGTIFERAEVAFVDSINGTGLEQLKELLIRKLKDIPQRDSRGMFRLPIDHVFTLQGQGKIVRGTIYEGTIHTGDSLLLLPHNVPVKARQLQIHGREQATAIAGQRVAINVSSAGRDIMRGDVLVSADEMILTRCIDLSLTAAQKLRRPLKQRAPVKFYAGTSEVMGKIVYFDRNELKEGDEVLCQVRLEHDIIVRRGDRFVVRRPTPVETVGGGWVIDPAGTPYRFGTKTMEMLERKRVGSPQERMLDALYARKAADLATLGEAASLPADTAKEALDELLRSGEALEVGGRLYTSRKAYEDAFKQVLEQVQAYHRSHPLRTGIPKAECVQAVLKTVPRPLAEAVLDREAESGTLAKKKQFIASSHFEPHMPSSWKMRMEAAVDAMKRDGLSVRPWEDYAVAEKLPAAEANELRHHLLDRRKAFQLEDKLLVHRDAVQANVDALYRDTGGEAFTAQAAKAILGAPRKTLIPFLELLDELRATRREGNERIWLIPKEGPLPF
jgi:selenocysteine-specific elongation factor